MKTLLSIFILFTYLANSCSNDPEPEVESLKIEGKYEITFIYEYISTPEKSPIQASINTLQNTNFIDFKSDGSCVFQNTNLSIRGISTFGRDSYSGSFKTVGNELELNFIIEGNNLKYYASVSEKSDGELRLKANKEYHLKALMANSNSLNQSDYDEYLAEYNKSTRFEQEVTLEKK